MGISKICVICVLLRLFSADDSREFTNDSFGNTDPMDFADYRGFFVWEERRR